MASTVHYTTTRDIIVPQGTQKVVVQIPTALNASLFAYSQRVLSFSISYSTKPDQATATNGGIAATWLNPPPRLSYTIAANLTIDVQVAGLNSDSQLPIRLNSSDQSASEYLAPSKYVQSNDSAIKKTAETLISNAHYESAAVTSIMLWVRNNLKYDSSVTNHDAAWTFYNKRGTCENYAQLSLALLRSVGIPARYVSGYLVGGDITISSYLSTYGYTWNAGPHAWIEVYYPDIGWVPYEPQQTLGFVDDHHVRVAVGTDSSDVTDTLIQTYATSDTGRVVINESSDATLPRDTSTLHVVSTSAASSQGVMSQEMAHGGVINDQMNTFDSERVVSELAVPVIVAVGVAASLGFLRASRRRR
ncbi:MAG: transglutaminase-like domain-containing protein [Halobacteriota archaeon]